TKATAAAIYSLLLFGDSWLEETKLPAITLDNKNIMIAKEQTTPGLGYFKINKSSSEITTGLANFKIENPNSQVMWGAAYWQYFEDIDKITSFRSTPLSIKKQIMVERVQNNKTVLMPATNLEVGDKVVMRMELKTDRPMDYIHLKDMRAAGLEPINVISQYKYQGGLGYYESTKDLATHFFFDHIVPGTYVFEYAMRVAQKGDFSNGISTLECMYAPEFSSHTSGATVSIK
ncbi:MAG: alpha-2-macroglobulin, partial [Saprospiraceae bacterium]|nr:alpha-2-macroglobulin [Saprospiraceae bacterium]